MKYVLQRLLHKLCILAIATSLCLRGDWGKYFKSAGYFQSWELFFTYCVAGIIQPSVKYENMHMENLFLLKLNFYF